MSIAGISSGYLAYGPYATGSSAPTGRQPPIFSQQLSDLDTNGDGVVSQAELTAAMEKNAPSGADMTKVDDAAAKLFKKMDGDGNGSISTSEWSSFQQKVGSSHHHHHHGGADSSQGTSQSNLQALAQAFFKAADSNGDGTVTQDEMNTLIQNLQSAGSSQSTSSSGAPSLNILA